MNSGVGSWGVFGSEKVIGIKSRYRTWPVRTICGLLAAILSVGFIILDIRSSWLEAHVLPAVARRASFSVNEGQSHAFEHPAQGPYDQRLGFF